MCLSLKLRLATQIFWLKTQILSVACRFLKRLCFTILVKRMSLEINILKYHCVKSVQIQSFSCPYFPALGLNMEIYGVNLRIQSESVFSPNAVKYGPEKTPYLDTFHAVYHSVKSQQPLFARSKNLWWFRCLQIEDFFPIIVQPCWYLLQILIKNFNYKLYVSAGYERSLWVLEFAHYRIYVSFWLIRSSRSQMFFKIGVLKNFAIITGKHLCRCLILKRDSNTGISCEYCEIFKNSFLYRTPAVAD